MDNLPNRLKARMTEVGITVRELSDKTEISISNIHYYRVGKVMPRQRAIKKMAEVLKVSPSWLMGWDVSMYRIHEDNLCPNLIKAIANAQNLNDEGIKKFLEMSEQLMQLEEYKKN